MIGSDIKYNVSCIPYHSKQEVDPFSHFCTDWLCDKATDAGIIARNSLRLMHSLQPRKKIKLHLSGGQTSALFVT